MWPLPNARLAASPARAARGLGGLALLLAASPLALAQSPELADNDRIAITGRQNLTLGSGARAYGMGGAFLARADDATAASWNPAGLSYLRVPEVSLVGVFNSFDLTVGPSSDVFEGRTVDFAAFTWPVGIGEARGAVQLSYQRALSFDGSRSIKIYPAGSSILEQFEEGRSEGGFDVIAFGTGLRLSRHVRAGFAVNRWLNGYEQTLSRTLVKDTQRPLREFDLDFRPDGWSFNLGLIVSPVENVNLAAVYKTKFTAATGIDKARRDYWGTLDAIEVVTTNGARGDADLELPSSFGFGVSWRPRDTLTLSADYTRTNWSEARITGYFDLAATGPPNEGVPATPPPPVVYGSLQYPTLRPVPDPDDPDDPLRALGQQDPEQIRVGVEWVLIRGSLKVPLRAGYFNDRQITPVPSGAPPRFNGFTVGTGLILGSMLLDVAYIYEFGEYTVAADLPVSPNLDLPPQPTTTTVRNTLTTNRFYASVIYRFRGRWRP